jgi:DNA modification methylase
MVGNLEVQYRRVSDLKSYERNSRTHSESQIAQLAAAIQQFGFTNPILIGSDGVVIAGHGRLEAARKLNLESVPTIELAGLSDADRRALVIADNRIAENSGWDAKVLALELGDLQASGFNLALLGFSDRELGEALQPGVRDGLTHPDEAPAVDEVVVSKPGDIWLLGGHRVGCGDCRFPEVMKALLAGKSAAVVWTDPPYNVAYGDKAEALQKYDKGHRNTSRILNDDMSDADFLVFLTGALRSVSECMEPGAAIYVAHSETEGINFRLAFNEAGFKLSSCVIWRKDSLVLGRSDFQWIHEPILYGWKPGAGHKWYGGRKQVSVQDLGADSPFVERSDGRMEVRIGDRLLVVDGKAVVEELVPSMITEAKPKRNDLHPTMKPVALVERMLRFSARPGAIVLDPFGGSGSTLIACERLGMAARTIDLSPAYVDVIVRRWQDFTGNKAVREMDGMEFDDARSKTHTDAAQADHGQPRTAAA